MRARYDGIAGGNHERLAALSDGVFAVVMTLLVLDLHAPLSDSRQTEGELWRALLALAPRLLIYLMSFMTAGIFWLGQQTQLNHLARSDRDLSWLHLAFLFTVTLLPFSTLVMANFPQLRVAVLVYWANIALLGATLFLAWRYAERAKLLRPGLSQEQIGHVCGQIVAAQSLYAFGALLCIAGPGWSIGFILLVQLNYVLAPLTRRGRDTASN